MGKRVLVFGSYVTDLCGRANQFPKAGETVKGHYFKHGPGGKGSNQAVAAKRADADLVFITKLGDDFFGKQALEFYQAEGISTDNILIDSEAATGAALIIVDETTSQNQIVVIGGACENFTDADMPIILKQIEQADILLIQLETNMEPIRAALKHAKNHGLLTVLNPAPAQTIDAELYHFVDIITPNETEAEILTGINVTDKNSAQKAAHGLLDKGVKKVIITLGEQGAFACDNNSQRMFGAVSFGPVIDTTGAGDAFSGGLAAALADGLDFFEAVEYAGVVAGISVTRHGTAPAMPYRSEIEAALAQRKDD